jgi:pyruvate formate lyase activating enzyme
MVFNIQRYSTHDGEGIRTMIFYKGCPLRCQWCSNPESQSSEPSILFDARICKGFGDCILAAPKAITLNSNGVHINRPAISHPLRLKDVCLSRALTVAGENKRVEDILQEIEKDLPFYQQSKGGVTLSGGEPLSQGPDLTHLLEELRMRNIHVSVETSLHVHWKKVARCLGLVSTYLVDLKHINREKFRLFTQGNIDLVLTNLRKLVEHRENIILRIPVVPDFNHSMQEMEKIINFAASLQHIREIHFIPYHTLGIEKYNMLGMNYSFGSKKSVDPSELTPYVNYALTKGLITKIGG